MILRIKGERKLEIETRGLVTIIVPLYNTQRYIKRCLESLINQTYKNIEILVVDNDSKDSSPRIVEQMAKQDSRIKLLRNKKTFSVGYSRNRGLDNAKGEYIWFVDSDDYAENNFLEVMIEKMEANEVNIIQCCYRSFDDFEDYKDYLPYHEEKLYSGVELCKIMNQFIGLAGPNIMVWTKLFRRKVLQDIRFYEAVAYEDMFFSYKVLYHQKKVLWIPDRLMNWRINSSSNTSKYNYCDFYICEIQAYIERAGFFKSRNEIELYELVMKRLYYVATQHLYLYKKFVKDKSDVRKKKMWLISLIKKSYPKLMKMDRWTLRTRMRMTFIRYFPSTFGRISVHHRLDLNK